MTATATTTTCWHCGEPIVLQHEPKTNVVHVRWLDGYLEAFSATEVRFGSGLLWMRLVTGENRHISLRSVRWFSTSVESHASTTPA